MVEEAGLEIETELQLRSDCGNHIYYSRFFAWSKTSHKVHLR